MHTHEGIVRLVHAHKDACVNKWRAHHVESIEAFDMYMIALLYSGTFGLLTQVNCDGACGNHPHVHTPEHIHTRTYVAC